ncbi:DNA-binding response OmpR family regulator [Kitasatospora gansuensis]|uniref:DNA-binding response OmpR family regulator n=1 Tax=Kitasatospora gansuensis TaxID=258050 RepID=A0A7W7WFR6_9ACTN|nr:hypothetical protein [Kitasatospora gansuensis]MBB4946047.1 DNA-binding response OmpR family regulator [Kitasatospora gansuensis]
MSRILVVDDEPQLLRALKMLARLRAVLRRPALRDDRRIHELTVLGVRPRLREYR